MSVSTMTSRAPSRELDAWQGSPLPAPLAEEARRLVDRLDASQRLWLSGFLAGAAALGAAAQEAPSSSSVTIVFGSQSGNAERLAHRAAEILAGRGITCTVRDMIDCGKAELLAAQTLLVLVSTQGEGDPPDRALPLWELLNGRKAPALSHLSFAVLALGDSSYQHFCETGKRFDAKLEALGARRIHPRVDCDVDFEAPSGMWMEAVSGVIAQSSRAAAPVITLPQSSASLSSAFTRRNPFQASVLVNQKITGRGSSKDVRHIELSLEGSNIRYEPGDAIGVVPRNPTAAADELLQLLPFAAGDTVTVEGHELALSDFLRDRADIGRVDAALVGRYAEAIAGNEARSWIEAHAAASQAGKSPAPSLADLVRAFPPQNIDAQAFVGLLRPLAPRLYSIASSLLASPDEAHLCVSIVEWQARGRKQRGLVSGHLADLTDQDSLAIYLHRNTGFRLPSDDASIIMIGAGTGVAPYRAFVAEREARGSRGRNWLIYGDRSFETDFLYQSEWLAWRKQRVLTRIDVAFSRDQEAKRYVQHQVADAGKDLWAWLQEGARLYVCGDASGMAPGVHEALLQVAERHGGLDREGAAGYLVGLQRERRYQRDVY